MLSLECREVEALRARNAELTHDVVRLSSSQPGPVHHVHSGESDGHAAHEVASLLGQLSQMQARVAVLEADVASARIEASEARAALQKADAELEGLSSAYASVDAHANEIQNQLEQAELRYKVATAGGASAHAGMDAAAVEQRVKDAVAAAVEEVQQEGDAAMEDLLVCLGQEESKVQRLREQLQALGAQPAE
jgi:chromosome segregation ATPase